MKKLYFLLVLCCSFLANAQVVNLPDANFKAKLIALGIDTNGDTFIQTSEALAVTSLEVSSCNIADLTGIESFTNLTYLQCSNNQITNLNVNTLISLNFLSFANNQLTSINVDGLINLQVLDCSFNHISSLNLTNLLNIQDINCYDNQLTTLDVSNLVYLQNLACYDNQLTFLNLAGINSILDLYCSNNLLTSLDVSNLTNLSILDCNKNNITSLDVSASVNLQSLDCGFNQIQLLNINGLTNIFSLDCRFNQLTSLDVSNLTNLNYLVCEVNQISSLNINNLINIEVLACGSNQLYSLYINNLINLQYLECSGNHLTSLDIGNLINLNYLSYNNNQLPSIDISNLINLQQLFCYSTQTQSLNVNGLTNLQYLGCGDNQLTVLDISHLTNLQMLNCYNNHLTTLDVSNLTNLHDLYCFSNQLTSLFIKNGSNENVLDFSNNPNLQYICADDGQVAAVQNLITNYGYTNCHVNSYCSFTPGGTFYTIQGTNKYDENNNGCDSADNSYPNLKLSFSDGTNSGSLIADQSGSYRYDVQAGTQTFSPTLENPTYFTISPTTATVTFPTTTSPFVQDFCVTANGTHNDLEIVLLPIDVARPGFDATYSLIYKNKGTTTQSGAVSLTFDDAVLDFATANPAVSSQATNVLTWNFSNLLPFETREISLSMNLNSPIEIPALNGGAILNYSANVSGTTDETPIDNTSNLNQTVVNAFDPNDKTCTEGTVVAPSSVGQFVHYIIRFENTGSANAQNIVVKDIIDTTKYDISTLTPIKGSSSFITKISNSNQVEFVFQNINLPFDDAHNDGFVAFKIKTLPTLSIGDSFSNSANIYFDYNAPITTNVATTTISTLSKQDFEFSNYFTLSPNPAKDILNINTLKSIEISSISIYNVLGQIIETYTNPSNSIDVSNLKTGSYLLKIISEKGTSIGKFLKE